MQLTLHIPSPSPYWDAIHGILGQRIVNSFRKFQPRAITTLVFLAVTIIARRSTEWTSID